jgi:hypothetical protein
MVRSRTGIIIIWNGIRWPAMKVASSRTLPRKRYLASAKPAMQASASAPATAGSVMMKLFRMKRPMGEAVNTVA